MDAGHFVKSSVWLNVLFVRNQMDFVMASRTKNAKPVSGVYAIRCLANGKIYVGSSADLNKRIGEHKARLRAGDHFHLPRLQQDWVAFGAGAFVFYEQPVKGSVATRRRFERMLILAWDALEHLNGYNKMVGGRWGPEASIRNTEDKLVRYRKFCRLPSSEREKPMVRDYVSTFVRNQRGSANPQECI